MKGSSLKEMFDLPAAPPPRSDVQPLAAESFVATERPAKLVEVARGGEPATAKLVVPPSSSSRLSVDVPAGTLRKVKMRALERGVTVRELVIELLAREGLA